MATGDPREETGDRTVPAPSELDPGRTPPRRLAVLLSCLIFGCGDEPRSETDTSEEVWTAPPRKACSMDADCADTDRCTWNERCEADGFCAFRIITCDDFNECTSDSCDPTVGCIFENHTGLCDDDNPCTLGDQCKDGACFPSEVLSCDHDNPCTRD